MKITVVLLIILLVLSGYLSPAAAQKRIYIAPDDHTDYMWTLDEAGYRQAFLQMLDYYLNLADATANNPPPFQSRWNCDGSFWLWTYEKNKSAAEFERLINRIRSGHISVPLTALVSCYGGTPAEAVLRGMYYAGTIERRYNLRFPLAVAMENQTLPYGLGALWAGAGAKYSWRGICGCASKVSNPGDREHDIYWWTGPDGSRILMKWNSFFGSDSIGGYAEAYRLSEAINLVDSNPSFQSRYPYNIIGIFGKGWDNAATFTDEFVTTARSLSTATRQIIVSNEQDFFADFEATHGAKLPSVAASFGNEWELYSASMAEVSARVKRAVEKLRGAEALATLVSLQDPNFLAGRTDARDQAWMNLGLYWEHDWTADGQVSRDARASWQRRIAGEIESYVDSLQTDAAQALGRMIRKSGSHPRFYAFNPLSWTRTDIADFPYTDTASVHVIDLSTGLEAPSQIVTVAGQRFLRVLARDVPPVGYKVFEIRPGAGNNFSQAATVSGNVIENAFYRLTVADRGAILSLIDKMRGNRELARTIDGRAINDLGASSGSLEVEDAGPVSVTLRATAPAPLAHTSRITLLRDSNRIDIRNEITQNFGETYTWSFAFNLDSPDVWHEEVGAVIRAKLLNQGGHYSPRNARYDWLTLNHFADISSNGVGVTLSNADCSYMRLGNSTPTFLDTTTPKISPLVGGQVDGPSLGIPNQGGDAFFLQRFALQTHDTYDAAAAMRFALEHQNPLIVNAVTGGTSYPESSFSFVSISHPNVLLWAIKPAEEGIAQGIIARVYNLSADSASFSLQLTRPITTAKRTTHIETDLENATVSNGMLSTSLTNQQFQTFRLMISNSADESPPIVGITSPVNGERFVSPDKLTIIAVAADSDGTINKVEFFQGTTKLGEATTAPYRFTWNNVPAGNQLLIAKATDNSGRVMFSSPVNITVTRPVVSVSAANFRGPVLARDSIVAAFGASLATTTQVITTPTLPTSLGGTSVKVRDSSGNEHLAPLFFVSPTQVNYLIPPETERGAATVSITSGNGIVSSGTAQIADVAPGLFATDTTGQGVAAAVALRVKADNSQSYEPVVQFDPAQNRFVATPIDLGPESDQVFLVLFGTGIRHRTSLSAVSARLGDTDSPVSFADAQGDFAGLDQVNVRIPRSLIGRGEVDVVLTVDGQTTNAVKVRIK